MGPLGRSDGLTFLKENTWPGAKALPNVYLYTSLKNRVILASQHNNIELGNCIILEDVPTRNVNTRVLRRE